MGELTIKPHTYKYEALITFAQALLEEGQDGHACTALAVANLHLALHHYLLGQGGMAEEDREMPVHLPTLMKLYRQLKPLPSFRVVEESMEYLIQSVDNIPLAWKGSLLAYRNPDALAEEGAPTTSTAPVREHILQKSTKSLLSQFPIAAQLEPKTLEALAMGRAFIHDPLLAGDHLATNAAQNYVTSIEGELRGRVPTLDASLSEELSFIGIEVSAIPEGRSGRRTFVPRGLGSLQKLITRFAQLSPSARRHLVQLGKLAMHPDADVFVASLEKLSTIRNRVQHGETIARKSYSIRDDVRELERLIFGEGQLLRILAETH